MNIFPLNEGSYSVAADKKFIPFDEKIHNPKDRPASIFVHVKPFLVQTSSDLILLDTGLGYADEGGKLWLHKHIEHAGFSPDDVTMVLMSHLHYDHAGGMMYLLNGKWELSFPHADYYVQRGELENALAKPSKSYRQDMLEQLRRSGTLRLLDGSGNINSEISFELTGAHCEFHQVFLIESAGKKAFFGGDVLPEPIQLVRNYVAKYDLDGRRAMELRKEFGQRAVKENWACLFYHAKDKAVGRVRMLDGAFVVEEL